MPDARLAFLNNGDDKQRPSHFRGLDLNWLWQKSVNDRTEERRRENVGHKLATRAILALAGTRGLGADGGGGLRFQSRGTFNIQRRTSNIESLVRFQHTEQVELGKAEADKRKGGGR